MHITLRRQPAVILVAHSAVRVDGPVKGVSYGLFGDITGQLTFGNP
jgi:hypothetical protein